MVQRNSEWQASFNYTSDGRRTIAKTIVKCKGNLLKSAFYLGIHRSWLYKLIYRHKLWPLINEVRREHALEKHRRKIVRGVYV